MDLDGIGEDEKAPRSHKLNLEIHTPASRKRAEMKAKKAARAAAGDDTDQGTKSGRSLAKILALDSRYQKNLLKRMRQGIAGPVEIWVWRYAFGEPEKNVEEAKRQTEAYEKMRADVRNFLETAPERSKILEAAVTRAPRLLPLPRQPSMAELEGLELQRINRDKPF
jgi:hypothetical protein